MKEEWVPSEWFSNTLQYCYISLQLHCMEERLERIPSIVLVVSLIGVFMITSTFQQLTTEDLHQPPITGPLDWSLLIWLLSSTWFPSGDHFLWDVPLVTTSYGMWSSHPLSTL